MDLSYVSMLLIWTLAVLTTADPLCDPETQYLHNGECCMKCKPGTSMVSMGACRDPACKDCDENEYMDQYNTESKCELQPYCDPNSNFKWPKSTSKTVRHQCLCEEGFHCSSTSCITCIPHTVCEPGYGAATIGDQTHDTVCKKCADGTFSDKASWNGTCQPRQGLANEHVGLIIAVVLTLLVMATVAVLLYRFKCKGKTGHKPPPFPIQPGFVNEYNNGLTHTQVPTEHGDDEPIITHPTDGRELLRIPSQETRHHSGPPVENEEGVFFTENGDVLSHDEKTHVMSQPETGHHYQPMQSLSLH